jgi:hypothetical protein
MPGYDSNGKKSKYASLISAIMAKSPQTAIISTNNLDIYDDLVDYAKSAVEQIKQLVEYATENAMSIAGSDNPKITLYGSSAGGGAVTLAAGHFSQVDSLILTGPSLDLFKGLSLATISANPQFRGEVYYIRSADDVISSKYVEEQYLTHLAAAHSFKSNLIDGSDHAFELPSNQQLLLNFVVDSLLSINNQEA